MENLEELALRFTVRILKLNRYLNETKNEFMLSRSLSEAGTQIGLQVKLAGNCDVQEDYLGYMHQALEHACEAEYWIDLLHEMEYLDDKQHESIADDCCTVIEALNNAMEY